MNRLYLVVPFSAFLALGFASMAAFGAIAYRKKSGRGYSFLTLFPFELSDGKDALSRVSRVLVFVCACATALSSTILLWDPSFQPFLGLSSLLAGLGLLKAASFVFLFLLPAYRLKPHMLANTLYFAFVTLSCAVEGIFFLSLRGVHEAASLAFMGCEFALALSAVLISLNPKMGSWAKMKTVENEDGTMGLERPKPFVLAFSEWLLILFDLLGSLLFVIGSGLFELN